VEYDCLAVELGGHTQVAVEIAQAEYMQCTAVDWVAIVAYVDLQNCMYRLGNIVMHYR